MSLVADNQTARRVAIFAFILGVVGVLISAGAIFLGYVVGLQPDPYVSQNGMIPTYKSESTYAGIAVALGEMRLFSVPFITTGILGIVLSLALILVAWQLGR